MMTLVSLGLPYVMAFLLGAAEGKTMGHAHLVRMRTLAFWVGVTGHIAATVNGVLHLATPGGWLIWPELVMSISIASMTLATMVAIAALGVANAQHLPCDLDRVPCFLANTLGARIDDPFDFVLTLFLLCLCALFFSAYLPLRGVMYATTRIGLFRSTES